MAVSLIFILWNKWNIRGFVAMSLLLQIFLILFAPLRKKIANNPIVFLVWLAYLVADSVVVFGIGLINHHNNLCACAAEVDKAITAFWVSFLLLHLGGPDTITAFSLEDNSLWRRHRLNLICQGIIAISVFMQIFARDMSLVIPTILVFLAAISKNVERLIALYRSYLPRLKRSMLSQQVSQQGSSVCVNAMLVEELNVLGDEYTNGKEPKLDESIVVKHAYFFFQTFKVLIGDLIFSREEREISYQYFKKVSAMDALRVISVELQFIYDMLHTKVLVLRSKLSYLFRFIAFTYIVMAFIMFNRLKRDKLHALDVKITYSLLLGGIVLDVISLFMLIFSDWTVAQIKLYNRGSSRRDSFLNKLVSIMDHLRKPRVTTCKDFNTGVTYEVLDTPLIFRRWSESISACNFFSEFLKESPRKMHKCNRSQCIIVFYNICCFPILMAMKIISCFDHANETIVGGGGKGSFKQDRRSMITKMKYVSKSPFIKKLWIFIFEEVKRKSEDTNDPAKVRKIFDARGDMFLESIAEKIDCGNISAYVTEAHFNFSILTWHIATEIWYNREKSDVSSTVKNDEREFSKILSDYMVYLLLNQPEVVSVVAGNVQMTSADTLFEMWLEKKEVIKNVKTLCDKLYDDSSRALELTSPLGMGIKLAHDIDKLGNMKWEVMSGVWVEMLSYAAIHIEGNAHVLVLSKSGELLAFVWLLMVHFGFLYKPEWGISHERFHMNQQTS